MIACDYCGTRYKEFQSNCSNCGAPLPEAAPPAPVRAEQKAAKPAELPPPPPAAPRPVADFYAWKLLFNDREFYAAGTLLLMSVCLLALPVIKTAAKETGASGALFFVVGLLLLFSGSWLAMRYRKMRSILLVLRQGEAVRGQITKVVSEPFMEGSEAKVWVIHYLFYHNGRRLAGKVSTTTPPSKRLQPGQLTWVLYRPEAPGENALYPHP
ncbi:MAG: hypothetical protein AB1894_25865 [Chloroflexota bacterium]